MAAPAPLSSIFSPKIRGRRVEEVGARGGGFTLRGAVETLVEYLPGEEECVSIYVNGSKVDHATSLKGAEVSRRLTGLRGRITIRHGVNVPMGSGFGTSASLALTTILGLFGIAGRGISIEAACGLVHGIEVECGTGLNSEAGFLSEGLVLVVAEGAPPKLRVDSIPLPHDVLLISVAANPVETPKTLGQIDLGKVEEVGDRKLDEILEDPTPENFLQKSREFALESGLATEGVREIFEEMEKLPTIGYAQNMIGEACHALVSRRDSRKIEERIRRAFPEYFVASFEVGGSIRSSTGP
ncbi:MAG: hypothetical protein RMI78_04550 [Nitrososphaerota archaeon]|nr:hypothetical protein [Nitrososphaerota archaeon]